MKPKHNNLAERIARIKSVPLPTPPPPPKQAQSPSGVCYHEAGHAVVAFIHSLLPVDTVIKATNLDGFVSLGKWTHIDNYEGLRCVVVAGELASEYAVCNGLTNDYCPRSAKDFYLLRWVGTGDGYEVSKYWRWRVPPLHSKRPWRFHEHTAKTVIEYWPAIAAIAELLHKKGSANYQDVREVVSKSPRRGSAL